ncbi:hypothetical protein CC78DRAFT_320542 [Lojkania enalia]|uniref:Uncharacterized protein n=1 Tax=Lojkania enalia TaxID=147567 RepID=A0A9P4N2B2_9PLEO|nr:hypothetical protein CC78DRAFT_320542 [Didymosphaeria enalia]
MLSLQSLLSLPSFLVATLVGHALAVPNGFIDSDKNGDNNGPDLAAVLTGGERCNGDEIRSIREGFYEMNELFQAALQMDWDGDAERDYFGRPDRVMNFTDMVESNILRASQYSNLKGSLTRNPDIHVRCDDPYNKCREGNKKDGSHVAYNIGNEPHIVFCNEYFELDPLGKAMNDASNDASESMELMEYYNRATAWARQVMHIAGIGEAIVEEVVLRNYTSGSWTTRMYRAPMNTSYLAGVPNEHPDTGGPNDIEALKYAYGATRAKLVAGLSTQEPYDAPNNADTYALYAQARYIIQEKGFYPSMPQIAFNNELGLLTNQELQEGEKKEYACFNTLDVAPSNSKTNAIGAPISSSALVLRPNRDSASGYILLGVISYSFALSLIG